MLSHLIVFLLFLDVVDKGRAAGNSSDSACEFGRCDLWRIVVIPLLTKSFERYDLVKKIVEAVITDCRWYYDDVKIEFLTTNLTFILIRNPVQMYSIDEKMDEFKYEVEDVNEAFNASGHISELRFVLEHSAQYLRAVSRAIHHLSSARALPAWQNRPFGRFIIVITDFSRGQTGSEDQILASLNSLLAMNNIKFRSIRLELPSADDDKRGTDDGAGSNTIRQSSDTFLNIEKVRTFSDNLMRIALVESNSVLSALMPCPQLNMSEKMRHYHAVRQYYYDNWMEYSLKDSLIGLVILILAVLFAFLSLGFRVYEKFKAKRSQAEEEKCKQADKILPK